MVLYEPVDGRAGFVDIMNSPELIKFIQSTDFKKEYEKYTITRKVKTKNAKNKR